ncbi:MAG TPA: hypothetical protein VGL46_20575 [Pseudonocardiaceae bacterium]
MEAAALAAVTVLLGRPAPEVVAAARVQVAADACAMATAQGTTLAVPEHARALVRLGWLVPAAAGVACDVAATYLTLRLEAAERHTGVGLIDPTVALLPPVAWHERSDPGAAQLAGVERGDIDWGLADLLSVALARLGVGGGRGQGVVVSIHGFFFWWVLFSVRGAGWCGGSPFGESVEAADQAQQRGEADAAEEVA